MRTAIALVLLVFLSAPNTHAQAEKIPSGETAWNEGYPARGLHHADPIIARFRARASQLGRDGKLRVLIIGDSLSDGHYHWSHHFRENLQAAYGDGGPGNIAANWRGNAQAGWLFGPDDFIQEARGNWRSGWGGRGDVWPYLGWNGEFLATESADAVFRLDASGSRFTAVTSSGTFETFDGRKIANQAAGFTVRLDDQARSISPAQPSDPLDIALTPFEAPEGRHSLRIDAVREGTLYLHGVLVEKASPGVVVYNISRGGYWAHNYLWRQPGWDKLLAAMDPDLTIIFLTKPESGGSGGNSGETKTYEHEALRARVSRAIPRSDLLFVIGWLPRDGQSPADARSMADRIAWCEAGHLPYLNLRDGLDPTKMKDLRWFADNIHLAPPGGKGIGDGISLLFQP